MAGVTFTDSDSAPVPKFLIPDPSPEIFQIWESDSCSDFGYHRSSRNLPMFCLRNDYTDSCHCPTWKVTPDPVFHKFLTSGLDPGPKEKHRILPESIPALWIHGHLCSLRRQNIARVLVMRVRRLVQRCKLVHWRSWTAHLQVWKKKTTLTATAWNRRRRWGRRSTGWGTHRASFREQAPVVASTDAQNLKRNLNNALFKWRN